MNNIIYIYTDGSCDHKFKIGGWAAVVFYNEEEVTIQGNENDTTHNRMELIAVIKSIEYIIKNKFNFDNIKIFTDSQYVEKLYSRQERFEKNNFLTKKGKPVRNKDLVCKLLNFIDTINITFIKVKAHQKKSDNNYNRYVDKLSRRIVRQLVKNIKKKDHD